MHPSEPTTAGHLLAATTSGAGSRPTRRVRSACKCCLIVSIISLMTSTQLSCQTAAQGLSPPPTASVTTSRESPPRRPCNQQRHEEVDAESRFDYEIPLPAALQNQRHFRHQAEAQRQQWARGSHGSQMSVEGRRRQRQFSQQAALLVAGPAAADGSQPPTASSSQQPEEFSLAAPASSMVVDLATGASNQQSIVALADGSNLTSGSGYALPDAPPPSTTTASTVPTFAAPTAGLARENRSSSEPSPSPATSNAEQAPPTSTTPTLSGDTISSPVAPQPLATTSASAPPAPNGRQQQQQTRQQARRMDEISNSAAERHSSSPPAGAEADQQPTATTTQSHSISSSPSSVSIITPLIAPSAKQQQSSSSMVKPIFVVGNPIGDLDYTSTSYSDQRMHSNNNNNNSGKQQQRTEKRADALDTAQQQPTSGGHLAEANTTEAQNSLGDGERMNGPALVYSGGHLVGVSQQSADVDHSLAASGNNASTAHLQQPVPTTTTTATSDQAQPQAHPPSPRLLQGNGAPAVMGNPPRRPSLPPPVNQANAASGFRSPMSPSGPLIGQPATGQQSAAGSSSALQPSVNGQLPAQTMPNFYQTSPPYAGGASQLFAPPASQQQLPLGSSAGQQLSNKQAFILAQQQAASMPTQFQLLQQQALQPPQASVTSQPPPPQVITGGAQNGTGATAAAQGYHSRRPLNITRVEHISAECSNDLIRAVIVFNGTFKGIIYSSGYVNDPTCLYVNGTGLARYEFSIRLNQCGTLGRQELHQPSIPGEARRRDQVMWNTLSIQYNPVIEQEWDEHFRVSCEYGSDFWKTISFSPFNVETNTGAPVVFTINPPQCQMDVLLGHGMGPKIAVDGPVTVGDPLTLLIHMKSEKAGYDILVKNCVAHNGGKQRMQLIDSNGCVVNERFISPFRGTYNDNDLRHVTLYAYLKAFRFTGSPVLYLECEIHMCQSACPPQMCYWRRLSKRSVDNSDFEYTDERATGAADEPYANSTREPVISDSLSLFKALQVRQEPLEPERARQRAQQLQEIYAEDEEAQLVCYRHAEVVIFLATVGALLLLVLSIAITCFMRIRMLTRDKSQHFVHKRLHPASQSLSPSLLSIGDAISTAGSVLGHQMGDSNSLVSSLSRHSMMKPDSACWQQQTAAGNSRAAYPASSNQFSAHRNRSSIHGCNR